jgi:predicted esterase
MSSGLYDPIVPKQDAERLIELLKKAGAKVSLYWQNSGHELVIEDVKRAKEWLLQCFPSPV